jgi:hypothetical protein
MREQSDSIKALTKGNPISTMPNYWKIAPGRQAQFWRDCGENHCIPINRLNQKDLSALSLEQIESLLTGREQVAANSARSVHAFVHDIQPGDRVFANAFDSPLSIKRITLGPSDQRKYGRFLRL